jgi:hypothetical protein
MSFIHRFVEQFIRTMEKRAASQLARELRHLDPRTLQSAGISVDLLALGPSAYPWRLNHGDSAHTAKTLQPLQWTESAVNETEDNGNRQAAA